MNSINTPSGTPQTPEQAPSINSTARSFGNGVARITVTNGDSKIETNAGVAKDAPAAPASSSPQAGTPVVAKSFYGAAITGSQLRPDSVVKVGGIETSLRAAVAAGLIHDTGNGYVYADGSATDAAPAQGFRLADGRSAPTPTQPYVDMLHKTGDRAHFDERFGKGAADHYLAQARQNGQQEQGQQSADKVADLPQQQHAHVNEFIEKVGNFELERGMSEMIAKGALSDDAAALAAGQMGIEPSQVRDRAESIRAAYEAQARELVGPNHAAVFDYANASMRDELRAAIRDHVENENPRAYDQIVQGFWQNLSADEILSAANASELNARREGNGVVTIQTANMPTRMSWRAACKAGYVGQPARKR